MGKISFCFWHKVNFKHFKCKIHSSAFHLWYLKRVCKVFKVYSEATSNSGEKYNSPKPARKPLHREKNGKKKKKRIRPKKDLVSIGQQKAGQ